MECRRQKDREKREEERAEEIRKRGAGGGGIINERLILYVVLYGIGLCMMYVSITHRTHNSHIRIGEMHRFLKFSEGVGVAEGNFMP